MVDAALGLGIGAETEPRVGGVGVGMETVAGRRGGCETAAAAIVSSREGMNADFGCEGSNAG